MEVLLAIGLVAVAVLALVGLNIGGLKQMAQGQTRVAALDVAERVLEATKELDFSSIPQGPTFDGRQSPASPQVEGFPPAPYPRVTVNGAQFAVAVRTRKMDEHLKNVEVLVYYGDQLVSLGRNFSH